MLDRIQMIKAAAEKNQERQLMKNTVAKLEKCGYIKN